MRAVAIPLDQRLSANVLPVTIGNVFGVTFGNSDLCKCVKVVDSVQGFGVGVGLCRLVSVCVLSRAQWVLPRHTHSVGADRCRARWCQL